MQMKRWEYGAFLFEGSGRGDRRVFFSTGEDSIEPIGSDDFLYTLGVLGDAGWELVMLHPVAKGVQYIFKREVYDAEP